MNPSFARVWDANPRLFSLLRTSSSTGVASKCWFDYLSQQEQVFLNHEFDTHALELATVMDFNASRMLDHSVRAQVIPTREYVERMDCNRAQGQHSFDFMQERDTSPIDLVTRRYPRIAILKPYNTCAQVCVYCQRNREIAKPMDEHAPAPAEKLDSALRWLRRHPGVTEVLITGGDPLVAGTALIEQLLRRLARMRHIERIRIGSRVFVTLPQRLTETLASVIARYHEPGRRVYEFHPWEKGISLAPTCIETDVGIWGYLEWLRSAGESVRDCRSIWYYH